MTQKTSFKSRMKQAFSFFRSDLRACTPLLVVFGLISAVTVVICYTICVVLGEDMTFTGALLSLNFLGVTNSGTGIRALLFGYKFYSRSILPIPK